jgi:hypothetical protein
MEFITTWVSTCVEIISGVKYNIEWEKQQIGENGVRVQWSEVR